jgi:hypothetical protein
MLVRALSFSFSKHVPGLVQADVDARVGLIDRRIREVSSRLDALV